MYCGEHTHLVQICKTDFLKEKVFIYSFCSCICDIQSEFPSLFSSHSTFQLPPLSVQSFSWLFLHHASQLCWAYHSFVFFMGHTLVLALAVYPLSRSLCIHTISYFVSKWCKICLSVLKFHYFEGVVADKFCSLFSKSPSQLLLFLIYS